MSLQLQEYLEESRHVYLEDITDLGGCMHLSERRPWTKHYFVGGMSISTSCTHYMSDPTAFQDFRISRPLSSLMTKNSFLGAESGSDESFKYSSS